MPTHHLLDPTLDVVFKLLLTTTPESPRVLRSLLTAVLRPRSPVAHVTVLDPEIPREAVGDKGIVLDVLTELEDGTRIDVEMQADKRPAFRNRTLYYWARTFGRQLERGDGYHELRPVISVLFLDYSEVGAKRLHSILHVLEVHDHERYSDLFEMHLIELPELARLGEDERQRDEAVVRWSRFFAAKSDEQLEEVAKMDPEIRAAKQALERLSSDPDAQALARQRQLAMDTYRIEMGGARAEGRAEGKAEAVLAVLDARKVSITDADRSRISSCTDARVLDAWIRRAATLTRVQELFE